MFYLVTSRQAGVMFNPLNFLVSPSASAVAAPSTLGKTNFTLGLPDCTQAGYKSSHSKESPISSLTDHQKILHLTLDRFNHKIGIKSFPILKQSDESVRNISAHWSRTRSHLMITPRIWRHPSGGEGQLYTSLCQQDQIDGLY